MWAWWKREAIPAIFTALLQLEEKRSTPPKGAPSSAAVGGGRAQSWQRHGATAVPWQWGGAATSPALLQPGTCRDKSTQSFYWGLYFLLLPAALPCWKEEKSPLAQQTQSLVAPWPSR